jgi:putative salt-induced outer membrane protein YdiY
LSVAAVVALAGVAAPARADEVVFKNGDRVTGTVTEVAGGKLKIAGTLAGDVEVPLADVRTFSTDAPLRIRLADGTIVEQRVSAAPGDESGIVAGKGAALTPIGDIRGADAGAGRWSGSVVGGLLVTSGNSETMTASVGALAVRRGDDDRITLDAQYLFARSEDDVTGDDETTLDYWRVSGKYDYFFTEKFYGFALARAERDRVAELDLRAFGGAGVGYQWVENDVWNFYTEAGLGWTYEDYEDAGDDDYVTARLAYHYDRRLREGVAFAHNLEYLPSLEDGEKFNLNADAGLRVDLTDKLFAEFKVEWKHNSEPPADIEKDDLRYIVNAGWRF